MIWLTKEQIIFLHSEIIKETGGINGLRDEGMLDSAITTPFVTFDSVEMFPTLCEKVVRLAYGLVKNHPFVDGNKRIGAHTMLVCFALNGIELDYSQDELAEIFLSLADGSCSYDNLLQWVTEHLMQK